MKVMRKFGDLEIAIELTPDEIYKAHREYVIAGKEGAICAFITNKLGLKLVQCNIKVDDLNNLAEAVYEEELKGYTETYAVARIVIPELKASGDISEDISEKLWIEE